jgi:hypothetical protein
MGRLSPVPGRPPKDGKTAGGNFRNYSHLWELGWSAPPIGDDGTKCDNYANASKGQKPLIREFLSRKHSGPWFAAIADSGQKHVLPYVPINPPGSSGVVLFDDSVVTVPTDTGLIDVLSHLLTDGATKEELERGDYRPQTWQRIGPSRLRAFENTHGRTRGHWFSLAVWIAQRDEGAVADRMAAEKIAAEAKKESEKNAKRTTKERPAAKRQARGAGVGFDRNDRGAQGCISEAVQRAPADVVLGSDPVPGKGGSSDKRDGGRVDNCCPKGTKDPGSVQLGLFGD